MPRDGSGVYEAPPGTLASPDTLIESSKHNAWVNDLVQDANAARPVTAGGTGASNAADARDALDAAQKVHTHSSATTSAAGFMSSSDKTKLDGIAAGAQVNPTAAAIKISYESNANTNAFTDTQVTKLAGIASGATANSADATLLARANHTGTQAISTVSGLQTALDGKASTSHVHGAADITSGTLAVARGGTGGATAAAARTSLGVYSTAEVDAKTWSATDITSGTLPIARGGTGETTEAGMRGVYTGSSTSNTAFPIGTIIMVLLVSGSVGRNAAVTPYLHPSDTGLYHNTNSGGGAALAGTWRARGISQAGSSLIIAQRVA